MSIWQAITSLAALLLAGTMTQAPAAAPIPCAEKSVSAAAIRSAADLEAFVQCAYEYAQEMGTEEAHRAFHEDARWRSGQFYIFVLNPSTHTPLVQPPAPSREGMPWSDLIDGFDTDLNDEFHRVFGLVDRGWVYYEFHNPDDNLTEPKASYTMRIDWDGNDAVIGAGDLQTRPSRNLLRRASQRRGADGRAVAGKTAGVRPLRRPGGRIEGLLRHAADGKRSALARRFDLHVRHGHDGQAVVLRASDQDKRGTRCRVGAANPRRGSTGGTWWT